MKILRQCNSIEWNECEYFKKIEIKPEFLQRSTAQINATNRAAADFLIYELFWYALPANWLKVLIKLMAEAQLWLTEKFFGSCKSNIDIETLANWVWPDHTAGTYKGERLHGLMRKKCSDYKLVSISSTVKAKHID